MRASGVLMAVYGRFSISAHWHWLANHYRNYPLSEKSNYNKIRLGVDKNNPQSYGFWKKNGFLPVDTQKYIIMERNL